MKRRINRSRFCNKKGMTLVEVIVSMALLGILVSMALLVLSSSLLLSFKSEDNTRQTGNAGTVMNQELISSTPEGDSTQAIITFNDTATTITIDGLFVTTSSTGFFGDAEMKSFIPED